MQAWTCTGRLLFSLKQKGWKIKIRRSPEKLQKNVSLWYNTKEHVCSENWQSDMTESLQR